jgi:hypothetical protein
MNRPSQADYALCHPLSIALIFGFAFCLLARFCLDLQGHGSPSLVMPIVALVMCKRVADGRKRIASFNAWRGAWDAMSGEAPRTDASKPKTQRGSRALIAMLAWLMLLCWAHSDGAASSPAYGAVSFALLLLTLWGFWGALRRLGRVMVWLLPGASAPRAHAQHQHIVSICLRPPSRSPSCKDFTLALPDYCKALLAGNTARS